MHTSSREIDFDIGLNSLQQQLIDKMEQLNNMEIQLMRKYDSKITEVENHANLIKHLRKSILSIQRMFEDIKCYFTDLNMQFIYQYFRKKHVFIVLIQNYLAEAYMILLDQKNEKKQQIKVIAQKRNGVRQTKALDIDIRKLQLLDYAINSIDNEEQRLSQELKEMYSGLSLEKNIIKKIKPSTAVNQLLLIKQNMDQIVKNAESIFEQSYILKYQQFKNYIHKIGKSEDIIDIFYQNINQSFKQKFKEALSKACKLVLKQQKRSTYQDAQAQTIGECKTKKEKMEKQMQKIYSREKKNLQKLMVQYQNLKKAQQQTIKENINLSSQIKSYEQQLKHLKLSYEQLKTMYHQKRDQYDTLKIDSAWALQQKEKVVNRLYEEIQQVKKFKYLTEVGIQYDSFCNSMHAFTQTDNNNYLSNTQNQIIKLLKTNHDRSISKLAQKQKRIKDLEGNNKEIKTELTKIVETLLNQFNVPSQSALPIDETGKEYLARTLKKLETIKIFTPNAGNHRTSIGQEECAQNYRPLSLGEEIANKLALIARQTKCYRPQSSTSEFSMPQAQTKIMNKLAGNECVNNTVSQFQASKSTQTQLIRTRMSIIMKNIVQNCNVQTQTGQQQMKLSNKFKIIRATTNVSKNNSLRKPQTSSLTKRDSKKINYEEKAIYPFGQDNILKGSNTINLDNSNKDKKKQFMWKNKEKFTEPNGQDSHRKIFMKTDYKQSFVDLKLNQNHKETQKHSFQNSFLKRQIKTVKSCDRRRSNFVESKLKNTSDKKEDYFLLSVNKIKTEDEHFHNFLKFLQNVQNGDNSFIKTTVMKLLEGKTKHKLNKILFNYIVENRNTTEIRSLVNNKILQSP